MTNTGPSKDEFPAELKDRVKLFHEKLLELRECLQPLLSKTGLELKESLDTLDKAKFDLSICYGMSSLLWAYMLTQGEDPKETSLKIELDRIREYMGRVKEIEDRDKRPRVETGAAKRFVRNALYQQPSDDHLPAAKKRKF
ncbi:nuclear nucleic acid-binding protein C1D-like [Varroa jacobsoni]|uniref:Nuclear nucleic acid-binding protein C1D n=1 Tax=Varroa destructor TaxID=109461 RepID=A0A7M7JA21_VARDE|nr:nuclear nucleic acid-binding protein C1D-like [Varroa destructor]XP_022687492.1 nuclear nucleic acid-binding protein C1D-like [Varroa jacobsoni]